MRVLLERFAYTPMGTFGRLVVQDEEQEGFRCFSIENPWKENEPYESCIPEGTYSMVLGRFNRGGYDAYEITDVPGRSLIKIHRGNTMHDLLGCIAPGLGLGWVDNAWAVTNSRKAFDLFMGSLGAKRVVPLEIKQLKIKGASHA